MAVHPPNPPHATDLVNESVSKIAPFSALILTIVLVIISVTRFHVFEAFFLQRVYGSGYISLDETRRRGFLNHHVAGTVKVILLLMTAYRFIDVAFGNATLHSPFAGSEHVTTGDVLVVSSQLFIAMYVFGLLYRTKISPISACHHTGVIIIAQSAIAISLNFEHKVDATIEFVLCLVWGAFDIVVEFWPHVAIILSRVYPEHHEFLAKLFRATCFVELLGTTFETAIVMWLFGSLWDRWTLPFKVITPLLHVLFSAAQLWGAVIFHRMWKKQACLYVAEKTSDS